MRRTRPRYGRRSRISGRKGERAEWQRSQSDGRRERLLCGHRSAFSASSAGDLVFHESRRVPVERGLVLHGRIVDGERLPFLGRGRLRLGGLRRRRRLLAVRDELDLGRHLDLVLRRERRELGLDVHLPEEARELARDVAEELVLPLRRVLRDRLSDVAGELRLLDRAPDVVLAEEERPEAEREDLLRERGDPALRLLLLGVVGRHAQYSTASSVAAFPKSGSASR